MNVALAEKIRSCPSLPSLPSIAIEVLELAQSPDVDIALIAKAISKDAALSSKILRTVNSSFYGRSHNVATISHAMVILGLQSVKTLVLGFSLVMNLSKHKSKGFKHITYWKRSIYAATAARCLAAKLDVPQQEEAFLAALIADIGMLVLDQILDDSYGEVVSRAPTHAQLAAEERVALDATHAEVAGMLAETWKLPRLLSVPVAHHHSPMQVSDHTIRKLTQVVQLAGRCADVFVDSDASGAIADVRAQFQQMSGADRGVPDDAAADAILAEIGRRTKDVAPLFEINIGTMNAYDSILSKANEALITLTLQTQQQATQLQEQNKVLAELATRDSLTGLANRAAFDEFLSEHLKSAIERGTTLTLLLLDLDNFKKINDGYGHLVGDAVLKSVAQQLASVASGAGADAMAARYGGEEMALVLPGTPRAVAGAIADTVRRAIAAAPVQCRETEGDVYVRVTASIGVAVFEPGSPFREPTHLIKAADLAVYNAKHSGRNCVKVFSVSNTPIRTSASAA